MPGEITLSRNAFCDFIVHQVIITLFLHKREFLSVFGGLTCFIYIYERVEIMNEAVGNFLSLACVGACYCSIIICSTVNGHALHHAFN